MDLEKEHVKDILDLDEEHGKVSVAPGMFKRHSMGLKSNLRSIMDLGYHIKMCTSQAWLFQKQPRMIKQEKIVPDVP